MDLYNIRKKINEGITIYDINLRVTYYARVSTIHEEQKNSLKNQSEYFYEMIKKNKKWEYIDGYIDEGITGTSDTKRNNFMRMIEDAKKHKFDLIITKEISRFSRNTLDSIKYTRLLLSYGVFVLFINDNINTAMPDSELRLTIMASLAQDEIRKLSERVKFGMKRSIKKGVILGNNMLYGYYKDKLTGNLLINKKEAIVVRMVFNLYTINKYSLNKIANILNDEMIKTGSNKKWYSTGISRMLKNPKYKGYYCGGKSEVVDYMLKKVRNISEKNWVIYEDNGKIPPIVNAKIWDDANKRLKKRRNKRKIINSQYIFSSKIYCGHDGSVFYRRLQRKSNKDSSWLCSTYLKEGKKTCNSPNIRSSELISILDDTINELGYNSTKLIILLTNMYNQVEFNDTKHNIIGLDEKIEVINFKKSKLLELCLEKLISNNEFKDKYEELNMNLLTLQTKKDSIKTANNNLKDTSLIINYVTKIINDNNFTSNIISMIINRIIAFKENDIIKLDIYLNKNYIDVKYIHNKTYVFKRGYDTTNTKRYVIKYVVNYYL